MPHPGGMVGLACGCTLQGIGNPGVQRLALAAQQCRIGGVLHQRVLEGVKRVRGLAAAEDKTRFDELFQGMCERTLRQRAALGIGRRWSAH